MHRLHTYILLAMAITAVDISAQDRYLAELCDFCLPDYHEYAPLQYGNRLLFCSDREAGLLIGYSDASGKSLSGIFAVDVLDSGEFCCPGLFDPALLTAFHDGPLVFSPDSTYLIISRNIHVKTRFRNFRSEDNPLGLFSISLDRDEGERVVGFPYNDEQYSVTTPCFSPDGRYLYYASDMPGGFGGSDLYRSARVDSSWGKPENLGRIINTPGNEVFPFIASEGMLFFASDGHEGMGGKDLFMTVLEESGWSEPLHLDAPINSSADDFGIFTNAEFYSGYFSSNRLGSDDIFSFRTNVPQLFACDALQENVFCFEFWDEESDMIDSMDVHYAWEFSDNTRLNGLRVEKCFEGGGSYWARLLIIDESTDSTFLTQSTIKFDLEDHIQPYFSLPDTVVLNQVLSLSARDSYLPGVEIDDFIWDFGDGGFEKGAEVNHLYMRSGVFRLRLGVSGFDTEANERVIRCVEKQIQVVPDQRKPHE